MENKKTICLKCMKIIDKTEKGALKIWHKLYCSASPREKAIDYVTGEEGYAIKTDDGDIIVVPEKYSHCKDVNKKGNCKFFEPKTESEK